LMVAPITITLHPYLMRIAGSGDTALIERVIGNVVENLLLVAALTVGLTVLLHKDIARVLLGPEFRAGSVVMPAVVAGVFFFNIGTFVHKPFEIVGRTRVMLVFGVISAAANIGLCFALIPLFGYLGAAYATFLSYLVYTVCVGYLGRRIFRWRVNLRRLATYGAIMVCGVAAIYFLREAMGGLAYGWSLAVTVVASCALASAYLLALLRAMLKPGWLEGDAALPQPAYPSPRDFLPSRLTGRHRRHRLRNAIRSASRVTATRTETPAGGARATPPAGRGATQSRPDSPSAPSEAPNDTRPPPDTGTPGQAGP